jgi:hypothetical protein
MAAYNEVLRADTEVCLRCLSKIHRVVQFKYGETWQHRYNQGDRIAWGRNDIGEPGHELVVVIGHPDACPVCGDVPNVTYDVSIREDALDNVRLSDGTYDYLGGRTYFIVAP